MRPQLYVSCRQSSNDVRLRLDRRIFRLLPAVRQARDFGAKVGVAEERNGLTRWSYALHFIDLLRCRSNHAMKCRSKDIVTPACEQVSDVYDDCSWLYNN